MARGLLLSCIAGNAVSLKTIANFEKEHQSDSVQ